MLPYVCEVQSRMSFMLPDVDEALSRMAKLTLLCLLFQISCVSRQNQVDQYPHSEAKNCLEF